MAIGWRYWNYTLSRPCGAREAELKKCIDCKRLDLKNSPFRNIGFGLCGQDWPQHYFCSPVYPHQCADFLPADSRVIELRVKFLESIGQPTNELQLSRTET